MLQLAQLRCFVAVATELHFGRAAAALNMTQPPLTRQIQLLEHEVGVTLLERNRRQVRLTAVGRAFFREAQDILRRVQVAAVSARRLAEGAVGDVRLGFIPAASYGFLPRLVGLAAKSLPDVNLSMVEMQVYDQVEAVAAGRLDLGLVRPRYQRPDLDSKCVLRDPFVLAVPRGHRLASARLTPRALDNQPTIMYSPGEGQYMHEIVAAWFRQMSVHPHYVHYISHSHTILALVNAGLGIAVIPKSAEHMKFDNVCFHKLPGQELPIAELHMVWRKNADNTSALRLRNLTLELG